MAKVLIGITIVLSIVMGFTMGGFGKYQSSSSIHSLTVEKAFVSNANPNSSGVDKEPGQGNPVFSWPISLYLIATVVGIVAFRRNTFV